MLTHLALDNFVLIDSLDQVVRPGLCVITGETGAGKSIILTALGLVTGARNQPGLIGQHGERSEVTATFDLPQGHPCLMLLKEQDLDTGYEVTMRRTVNKDGRTKAFVNGTLVPVAVLAALGRNLIEIQGQFDQLAILNPGNHRNLLDATLGLDSDLKQLKDLHHARETAADSLESETKRLAQLSKDKEYLVHCLNELEQTQVKKGEAEELTAHRQSLRTLKTAEESLSQLEQIVCGDQGLTDQLSRAVGLAGRLPVELTQELESMIADLDRAWNSGENAASVLSKKLTDLRGAEQELETVSDRLFLLKDLARKHQCQPDQLIERQEELSATLSTLDQGESHLKALKVALETATQSYSAAADRLSATRKQGAKQLSAAINTELPSLHLPDANVTFEITRESDNQGGPQGYDRVRLLARTNRGKPAGPLEKLASGGELSRILLALKLALAPGSTLGPLLVFDEADSGVGGASAAALGNRLRRLAESSQVLAVTHSPQLAAAGDWHLKVTKIINNDQAGSQIKELKDEARTKEIARMLAGTHVGQEAYEAAKTLQSEFAA